MSQRAVVAERSKAAVQSCLRPCSRSRVQTRVLPFIFQVEILNYKREVRARMTLRSNGNYQNFLEFWKWLPHRVTNFDFQNFDRCRRPRQAAGMCWGGFLLIYLSASVYACAGKRKRGFSEDLMCLVYMAL